MAIEECKIFRPNKDGILEKKETISAKQATKDYWNNTGELGKLTNTSDSKVKRKTFMYGSKKAYSPVKCKLCLKMFIPNSRRQIYCNNPCVNQMKTRKDKNANKTRICKQCKKVFKTEGKYKYCHNPCTSRSKIHKSVSTDVDGKSLTKCGIILHDKHLLSEKFAVTCENCLKTTKKEDIQAAILYEEYLNEAEYLISLDPEPGTTEGDSLKLLSILIEKYEKENFPINKPDPH